MNRYVGLNFISSIEDPVDNKSEKIHVEWIPVGLIEDFVNNKSEKGIDPYFDWFISSLVSNLKNYQPSNFVKSNVSLFVYLLLNQQFQSTIRKIRDAFDIPINGFTSEIEYNQWRNGFFQAVNDYEKAKKIPLKVNKVITYIEKQIIRLSKGRWNINQLLRNPEDEFSIIVVKRLNIGQESNFKLWSSFIYHLIFTFNPRLLLESMNKIDIENSIIKIVKDDFYNTTSIMVPLNLDTTINSIQTMIEKDKTNILKTIEEMKTTSPKTTSQAQEIERDYMLYKNYTSFKTTKTRGDFYQYNLRKEDNAFEKSEKYFSFKTDEKRDDYNVEAIRKIVNRMKNRIRDSFIDKSDTLANLLTEIKDITPAPYPEYVENRN